MNSGGISPNRLIPINRHGVKSGKIARLWSQKSDHFGYLNGLYQQYINKLLIKKHQVYFYFNTNKNCKLISKEPPISSCHVRVHANRLNVVIIIYIKYLAAKYLQVSFKSCFNNNTSKQYFKKCHKHQTKKRTTTTKRGKFEICK
jgi:hypothetical protein